jgi:hypothetical protein
MINDQGKLPNNKQCNILVFVERLGHPNLTVQKPNTIVYI